MARTRVQEPHHRERMVRNLSSRNGSLIQAIAVHSTESLDIPHSFGDLDSVGNWFDLGSSQASAHVGIDGDGHSVRWVPDASKAWTILQLNDRTLNIEFVAKAAQAPGEWEPAQITKGAQWVAYWSQKYGIPIRKGWVRAVNGFPIILRAGVIRHSDLTKAGFGTHTDPGLSFPMGDLLRKARWYSRHGWQV